MPWYVAHHPIKTVAELVEMASVPGDLAPPRFALITAIRGGLA
jgi:hypothetical protein